ncbi:MAG: NAD(P)/FAD-dependent oxidoreductase [Nevskia sp.]|nr:NAD(P)/FAD-dependent oxidoreductase [Nevskia sp.]
MPGDEYDVIVIGGGSAGLMACVGAVQQGARVLLLEKGDRLGRKLVISGGGRCNVTNNKDPGELVANIPGNGRFLFNALHRFGSREIIAFFESLGVALKEEDNGRMFPVTDKATTVANTLIAYLQAQGVVVALNSPVARVLYEGGRVAGVELPGGRRLAAPAVVLAAGGKSVPRTGSTGDGYAWAREADHAITRLFPTEVPLTSDEPWIADRSLQGLSLRDVALTLHDARGKRLTRQTGDMIFTHFGFSGPAALRLAHYVDIALRHGGPATLYIDLMPARDAETTFRQLWASVEQHQRKAVGNLLKRLLPERLLLLLLAQAGIPPEEPAARVKKARLHELTARIHRFPAQVTGTLSIEEAFVTGGGVDVREIDPRTMASKRMPGLYFAGEVMDVHAHTGGYNITIAFSSGYVAGAAAAGAAGAR